MPRNTNSQRLVTSPSTTIASTDPRVGSGKEKKPPRQLQGPKQSAPFPNVLLDRVIEEFLYHHQQVSSPKTVDAYSGHLCVFVDWLKESTGRSPLLSDLTLSAADAWSRHLSTRPRLTGAAGDLRPIAWESRRTYLRTLRTFSNWLPLPPHSYCAEPPLRHLLLPRPSDTYKMPLAEGELAQLLAAAKENSLRGARDTAMLLMLIDGGLRAMELAMLRIGDVTLESGLVLVSRGKGNRSRVVTVGDDTRHNLRRFAAVRDSQLETRTTADAPFFPTDRGAFYSYAGVRSWIRRLGDRAGVPRAHLHLFRHTSAIETLGVGADVRTVQLKLGHASITTTQKYLNMGTGKMSDRQRQFSPVDHLRLMQPSSKPSRSSLPRWRRNDVNR